MDGPSLYAAGRSVPSWLDRVRRYCGLAWTGGRSETWAWPYYDTISTEVDDVVTPTDVICAAALHPGVTRDDLAWFQTHQCDLTSWLRAVPRHRVLAKLEPDEVHHVSWLASDLPGPSVSLLSKVLHRKRPDVVPIIDRHVVDWYRPLIGQRSFVDAWGPLVKQLWLEETEDRQEVPLVDAMADLQDELKTSGSRAGGRLSWVRAKDIAIWMGGR